jgi:bifunctional non-homologous end joining protein LigD
MSTGKNGYHVVTPVYPELDNDGVRTFALKIATVMENDEPDALTTELLINKRKNRVFIDVNRNSPHQTAIAPYSVRAVRKATVALPFEWNELGKIRPDDYDIDKTTKRMQNKQDAWIDFSKESQSIKKLIDRLKK